MKKRDRILIPFQGLKEGEHVFEYEIKNSFFEQLEYTEVENGELILKIVLLKAVGHLELNISIEGFVNVVCDRCLDEYPEKINFTGRLYVKFGDKQDKENDEIWVISKDENELDLTHYVYESINLSLPYRKIHPDDEKGHSTCNREMIQKLENHIIEKEKNEDITDPRWDKLKDLLRNN